MSAALGTSEETPNPARVYDYVLGGTHNFQVDEEFAKRIELAAPNFAESVRLHRDFLHRVLAYFVDNGISQFLDLGSGFPTALSTYGILQDLNPDARVLHVDRDGIVVQRGRSSLLGNASAAIIHADIRSPGSVFNHPRAGRYLDLSQPIGLLMIDVLPCLSDEDRPDDLVRNYTRRLAPESLVAVSHLSDGAENDSIGADIRAEIDALILQFAEIRYILHPRPRAVLDGWFKGLEPVRADGTGAEHGFVPLPDWRPNPDCPRDHLARPYGYGGVARVMTRT